MSKALGLPISSDLDPLPPAAVTQKFACLGISGSGKTYGAGKFTETLLDAGAQVVIVDTIGNWGQGLRLAADGKRPGIAIPILGGEHGDVPLDAEHGELAAATVVDTLSPLVLDVSDFTKGELCRFVKDFATELLTLKKRQKSPVMVVWEECQDIVPQVVRGEKAQMVGAVEALIKKGRNYGVGTMLISQRAAAVNKDVLNQIETLFAFRQNSKHDRLAVRDWIVSQAIDVENLSEQLPTLKTGECFCWSPSWLGILKKIKFGKKRTFDASRTPDAGDYVKPGVLAPVDLEAFKASMREAIEAAKADDPAELRKRIAQLEQELAEAADTIVSEPEPKVVEVPVVTEAQLGRLEVAIADFQRAAISAVEQARDIVGALPTVHTSLDVSPISTRADPVTKPKSPEAQWFDRPTFAQKRPVTNGAGIQKATNGAGLPAGELAVLTAIAQTRGGCSREQLTVLTGYKKSTRDLYLQKLGQRGFTLRNGDRVMVTAAGRDALPSDFKPLPTGAALRAHWLSNLPGGEAATLDHVIKAYPRALARDRLGELTGYKKSTRDLYLQKLAARRLVDTSTAGQVSASPELF